MLMNLNLNCEDLRLILNQGLPVYPGRLGLELRSKIDLCLGGSIDSKTIDKNV